MRGHSKLQLYQDRPEYWEESWRLKETWCHSNFSEKLSANAGVKNSQKGDNNNNKANVGYVVTETINHISECSKLAQKEYKTRHDWVGKVIHWKMCNEFKFDRTNKWYVHNPAPVLENDTHKLLWDFDIHTYPLIPVRRPNNNQQKKKKKKEKRICKIVDFAVPADDIIKLKECEKKDKYPLLGNWKNNGTWKWRLYQLWLVLLAQ